MAKYNPQDDIDFEEERKKRKTKREAEEAAKRADVANKRKKQEAEREQGSWKKISPGGAVRSVLEGDRVLAESHIGEGMNQLFILKNLMKLGDLPSLSLPPYILSDGTVISVQSIYGQDQVIINSPTRAIIEEVSAIDSCTVTFVDLPQVVQPMKYPGEIRGNEALGTDYIKTYYSVDLSKCATCNSINWYLTFTYKDKSLKDFIDPSTGLLYPNNHLTYSLDPPGRAEIISHGVDSKGRYIIWKAHTETLAFSRTGLGILSIIAQMSNSLGKIICFKSNRVSVDCCHKEEDLRKVEIWWEDFGTCQPYINYGGVALCKMPTSVPIGGHSGLLAYRVFGLLYAIPDINGGCLPFTWKASGALELFNTSKDGTTTSFNATVGCQEAGVISLTDRCGKTYTVVGTPCCADADSLSILYTSLLMSCGGQQDLRSQGGCPPYLWSLSGGGSIVSDGIYATYTAPDTNPNCVDNPTITVTDCCGNSASVSLTVNCYHVLDGALGYVEYANYYCRCNGPCNQNQGNCCSVHYHRRDWTCDGSIKIDCNTGVSACDMNTPATCEDVMTSNQCNGLDCYTHQCGCILPASCLCNTVIDERTDAMKLAGCCPLNPFTGAPY